MMALTVGFTYVLGCTYIICKRAPEKFSHENMSRIRQWIFEVIESSRNREVNYQQKTNQKILIAESSKVVHTK